MGQETVAGEPGRTVAPIPDTRTHSSDEEAPGQASGRWASSGGVWRVSPGPGPGPVRDHLHRGPPLGQLLVVEDLDEVVGDAAQVRARRRAQARIPASVSTASAPRASVTHLLALHQAVRDESVDQPGHATLSSRTSSASWRMRMRRPGASAMVRSASYSATEGSCSARSSSSRRRRDAGVCLEERSPRPEARVVRGEWSCGFAGGHRRVMLPHLECEPGLGLRISGRAGGAASGQDPVDRAAAIETT